MSSEIFNQAFESLSNKNSKMNVSVSELMGMNWHEMSYLIERFNNVNKQTKAVLQSLSLGIFFCVVLFFESCGSGLRLFFRS